MLFRRLVILFFIFLGLPSFANDLLKEDNPPIENEVVLTDNLPIEENQPSENYPGIEKDLPLEDDLSIKDKLPMENDLESDTIHMKGLTIHGEYFEKFSPGSTIKKSDSLDKAAFQPSNLNDIIGYKNPI